jgi:hypothetical protein
LAFAWEGNEGTRLPVFRPYHYGDFADFEFEFPGPAVAAQGCTGHSVALYGVRSPGLESGPDGANPMLEQQEAAADSGSCRPSDAAVELPLVRFASPQRAMEAIRDGIDPPLSTVRGEIVSPTTASAAEGAAAVRDLQPDVSAAATRAESLLQTAEAVATVAASLPGAQAYPHGDLESAWRRFLEALALAPHLEGGPEPDGTVRAALVSAAATADSIITDRFSAIRSEMETDAGPIGAFVLFNPLAHTRQGVSFVELGRGEGSNGEGRYVDARKLILVNIPEIPPLGAIVLPIGADGLPGVLPAEVQPPTAGELWLENAFVRIEIDPATGAIAGILDKTNRRQALNPGGRANALVVSPDPGAATSIAETMAVHDSLPGARALSGPSGEEFRLLSISSSVTAHAATVTITRGWNRSTVRQQLVLARAAPFLEVRTEINWQDAGWRLEARIDPVVQADFARVEAPYGSDSRPTGSARVHPALHWVDVSDGSYGLSILGDSKVAWRFDGESIFARLPAGPDATSGFAIYPHAGDWRTAGTASLANERLVPLLAVLEPAHGGRLGRRFSLVSTNSQTTRIEWVKRAEDDEAIVLRLVERSGRPSEALVSTACPQISAWRANHLEEPLEELPSSDAEFRIRLRGYEIATVRVACRG